MRQLLPLPATDLPGGPEALWPLYALPDSPLVRAGFVTSLDGAVAVDGTSLPLSGPADRSVFRALRAVSDVVLVGAGTAREEDYGPIPLSEGLRRRRLDGGYAQQRPSLAVATNTLRLDPTSRLLLDDSAPVLLLAPEGPPVPSGLPSRIEVLRFGAGALDVTAAVRALQERGMRRVLCEGGPRLLADLLREDLVDELCLTTSPQLVGSGPALLPAQLPEPRRLRLVSLVEDDGALLGRWSLR